MFHLLSVLSRQTTMYNPTLEEAASASPFRNNALCRISGAESKEMSVPHVYMVTSHTRSFLYSFLLLSSLNRCERRFLFCWLSRNSSTSEGRALKQHHTILSHSPNKDRGDTTQYASARPFTSSASFVLPDQRMTLRNDVFSELEATTHHQVYIAYQILQCSTESLFLGGKACHALKQNNYSPYTVYGMPPAKCALVLCLIFYPFRQILLSQL